jgi:hypothetical protein
VILIGPPHNGDGVVVVVVVGVVVVGIVVVGVVVVVVIVVVGVVVLVGTHHLLFWNGWQNGGSACITGAGVMTTVPIAITIAAKAANILGLIIIE